MRNEELRAVSDKMLVLLERLSALEKAKQEITLGSNEFVVLAEQVEQMTRVAKVLSEHQLDLAYKLGERRRQGEVTNVRLTDLAPRRLDRILADWREAEMRLATSDPGSEAARRAAADVERLKAEYRAAQQDKPRE